MHDFANRKDGWSADHDQKIIELRDKGLKWKDIGDRIGRTDQACCARYRVIVPKENRRRYAKAFRWRADDIATLKKLIDEKRTPRQIAHFMGLEVTAIHSKIQQMRAPGRRIRIDIEPRLYVAPHVFEERDRRLYGQRDLTAVLLGDPPPGQSALDKRQGASL